MPQIITCPQGHQWELPTSAEAVTIDAHARCPVCGAAAAGTVEPLPGTYASLPAGQATEDAQGAGRAPGIAPGRPSHIGGYELLGELGRGGMGVVYQARQIQLNRTVALKMVLTGVHADPEHLARFRLEAEAVARLQHPNIVQIYEVGEHDGQPFFSLEFVEGGSLERQLDGTPQPALKSAQLVEQLARAMHAAHERGIIHRDLKPANVLLMRDGTPKLTDFGLAKLVDAQQGQTQTGDIMGTPSYMSPEQAAGRTREIGPATDIYALGTILYDLLTGRPPFQGTSILETLEQVRSQEPVPPSRFQLKLPRDLETICLKCLQKDVPRRYATARDLAEDLRRFQAGEPIQARPVGLLERGVRWCRRNPIVATLLAALAVVVVTCTVFAVLVWVQADHQYHSMALQGTRLQATTLESLRKLYSDEVVARAKDRGVSISHDYRHRTGAIPLPATLVIELGQDINRERPGADVRLYSDYPFPWRPDGGPRDDFEKAALNALRQHPDEPYHRFEVFNGRPSLRFAVADRMQASCVQCHNSHPDSPRRDWRVGDVRGVLEIIRPLDDAVAQNRQRLRWVFSICLTVIASVFTVLVLLLLGRRLRRRAGPQSG